MLTKHRKRHGEPTVAIYKVDAKVWFTFVKRCRKLGLTPLDELTVVLGDHAERLKGRLRRDIDGY